MQFAIYIIMLVSNALDKNNEINTYLNVPELSFLPNS